MALLNDILKWTENLPAWQRDATRRLFQQKDGLKENDYSELYILLKKENDLELDNDVSPVPLAAEHLPAELIKGDTVTLLALRELENVNLIPSDHILEFSETGLTVIYGGNGSGKSGYARVIKRACRARDQSEPIHPNANDSSVAKKVPTAKFDVKNAGDKEEIFWYRDSPSPDQLSTISVFDSKCARSYITAEKEVAYLPYGLDIVENLANLVLPKLLELLNKETENIDVDKRPLDHLLGETKVGKVIRDLSVESDADAITSLGTLTDRDNKRVAELNGLLKEADPLAKAKEIKLSVKRLETYAEKLAKSLVSVNVEAAEELQRLADEKRLAESAETTAADALRAGENLLPGTGEQAWKLLFEAARHYSTEAAYPGGEFPPSAQGNICPLCQEDLGEAGTGRLNRFDEYIKNDVAKKAAAVRRKIEIAQNKLKATDLQVTPEEALSDELNALDASLLQNINDFQVCIDLRRDSMLKCLDTYKWEEIPTLIESPQTRVSQLAAHQLKKCQTLVDAAGKEQRKELEKELSELTARQNLSKSLEAVLNLLVRIMKKAALEKMPNKFEYSFNLK